MSMPRFIDSLSNVTGLSYKLYNCGKISDVITQDI